MTARANHKTPKSYINSDTSGTCVVLERQSTSATAQAKTLTQPTSGDLFDVVIVGAGPAALTAAIYTARDDLKTVVVEKSVIGGIPATIDMIENYPGFPDGVTGLDLADKLTVQAEKFGAKIELSEVTGLQITGDLIRLQTTDGELKAKAVLIATGSDHKKLNVPGETEYYGRGVHYCATCDGALYRDKKLVVVGGGNSAVQEALFLTRYASHIDLLVRSTLKADEVLIDRLQANDKIKVHLHTTIKQIVGDENSVKAVVCNDIAAAKETQIKANGVFIFAGQVPNTAFLASSGVVLDEAGFVQTNSNHLTSVKGVFAAGDVRAGATMQIACAVGEGAAASYCIREYLNHFKGV